MLIVQLGSVCVFVCGNVYVLIFLLCAQVHDMNKVSIYVWGSIKSSEVNLEYYSFLNENHLDSCDRVSHYHRAH